MVGAAAGSFLRIYVGFCGFYARAACEEQGVGSWLAVGGSDKERNGASLVCVFSFWDYGLGAVAAATSGHSAEQFRATAFVVRAELRWALLMLTDLATHRSVRQNRRQPGTPNFILQTRRRRPSY